jgi:hypothetical protein
MVCGTVVAYRAARRAAAAERRAAAAAAKRKLEEEANQIADSTMEKAGQNVAAAMEIILLMIADEQEN